MNDQELYEKNQRLLALRKERREINDQEFRKRLLREPDHGKRIDLVNKELRSRHGNPDCLCLPISETPNYPKPTDGCKWGPFVFSRKALTLTHEEADYELDLERFTNSAEVLDMIIQLAKKRWMSREDVGAFVEALDDLLDIQRCIVHTSKIDPESVKEIILNNSTDELEEKIFA